MIRALHSIATHAYGAAAVVYLVYLIRPWRWIPVLGRVLVGTGLVLHGVGLGMLIANQGGMPVGIAQAFSAVAFLLVALFLFLDLLYRVPVLGAFFTPFALVILVPGLLMGSSNALTESLRGPLLPLHVTVALLGMSAFAVAAVVGLVYLLMERQVKGKRFGVLFSRLPSLQLLDDLNRRLVIWGFIALSITVVTGGFFGGDFFSGPKQVASMVAWLVFGALLNARAFAGWQGRRVAMMTMAGFAILIVSFWTAFEPATAGRLH